MEFQLTARLTENETVVAGLAYEANSMDELVVQLLAANDRLSRIVLKRFEMRTQGFILGFHYGLDSIPAERPIFGLAESEKVYINLVAGGKQLSMDGLERWFGKSK